MSNLGNSIPTLGTTAKPDEYFNFDEYHAFSFFSRSIILLFDQEILKFGKVFSDIHDRKWKRFDMWVYSTSLKLLNHQRLHFPNALTLLQRYIWLSSESSPIKILGSLKRDCLRKSQPRLWFLIKNFGILIKLIARGVFYWRDIFNRNMRTKWPKRQAW